MILSENQNLSKNKKKKQTNKQTKKKKTITTSLGGTNNYDQLLTQVRAPLRCTVQHH